MNKLWAPWRISYLKHSKSKGCVFCSFKKSSRRDAQRYIILRGKHSFSVLNLYPYNNGHFMVCPYRHLKTLEELAPQELHDMFDVLKRTKKRIEKILKPEGFNIGINLGTISGAGIANHIHIHVVPRWGGDTNFMPVLTNTKVISQSLDELYRALTT